ncbi:MAG: bile acid:sodium symporter [bacterium]
MFTAIKRFLVENQIVIVLVGLLAGLFYPELFKPFHSWNTFMLQLIFFLSALRIDINDLKKYTLDWKMNLLAAFFMLVFLPVAVYLPLKYFAPHWALAFLIALAGPTGMTIALVADFFHGKTSLALVISVVTSILAPFTMPIVFQIFAGAEVHIHAIFMLRELATAILIPFILAYIVSRLVPKLVARGSSIWRTVSVMIFGLLIASIVSKTAVVASDPAALHLSLKTFVVLMITFFYIAFLVWISYRMIYWRNVSERITIALCMMYMNFTLALYVGDQFFSEQKVVPQLVVIVLLLDVMLPFLKVMAGRVVENEMNKK